jgi:hypothetical protein
MPGVDFTKHYRFWNTTRPGDKCPTRLALTTSIHLIRVSTSLTEEMQQIHNPSEGAADFEVFATHYNEDLSWLQPFDTEATVYFKGMFKVALGSAILL